MFHGDDFLAEGHDSSLNKLDEVLGAFVQQKDPMERIWILVSNRSQTRGCIDHDLVTGRRETCRNAIHTRHWKRDKQTR